MISSRVFFARLCSLFAANKREQELDAEVRGHLDLLVEENIRRGMNTADARNAARREFGGGEQTKEVYRRQRGLPLLETLVQDVRFGLRTLRKNPGFTGITVLTLALGIGANTAIFSILDPLLLRKLPVSHPDELVRVDAAGSLGNIGAWEASAYERFRDSSQVFSGALAFIPVALDDVAHDGQSGSARAEVVSANYFTVLGLRPFAGRLMPADEERGHAVVLGFDYWRREFAADVSVLGKHLIAQGAPYTIIGIAPYGFFGLRVGEAADFYLPSPPGKGTNPNIHALDWTQVIARLKPGVSPTQAFSALQPELEQIQRESHLPKVEIHQMMDHLIFTPAARGLSPLRYRFSLSARILMGVVGLVLLIACSNVANLLLAQNAARKREITIRLALGAQRSRLVRQLLTEGAVLAVGGALGGMLGGEWVSSMVVARLSQGRTHVILATV